MYVPAAGEKNIPGKGPMVAALLERTALRNLTPDGWLLFFTRFARLFAYGALSVVLVLYLTKSVHSGIGHSSNELRATAVSCSETGTTPINRIAEEDLPCPPALSSKSPQKNKPVYWQSCVGLAETSGSLFTSCFC